MSGAVDHPLNELDQKAQGLLGDKAVIKSLAAGAALTRLPRYVSEYMIAKYVKPATWRADLESVQTKIRELLPELEQRELVKEKLLSQGQLTVIDAVDCRVDLKTGKRFARVPCIGDINVRVPAEVSTANPGLLMGGLWGTAKIRYTPEQDEKAPNELVSFTPFQVGPPDLAEFRSFRAKFTSDEWQALVLQSAGYAASAFPNRRTRFLLIARMLPLVERNLNLVELGPRQTGKTFLLRNLSPRVFTMSGGKTTPANLFVNLSTKQVGILGNRKVVVFDEIANADFTNAEETIGTLKDYMESGNFSRGSMSFVADAGLVFAGNIDVDGNKPAAKYRSLFEPMPELFRTDSAFYDRMHGYIPGWEVPKISTESIATGVGFVTDYFGEAMIKLREDSFADRLSGVPLQPGMTKRDTRAVERITSGLIKVLYPHGLMSPEELHEVVTFACELRQRVHNQLCVIAPGEFKERMIAPVGVTKFEVPDMTR
ncbi:MAG: BREX system Lon protease-like protein BrxL [Gemmataceae bacterium]